MCHNVLCAPWFLKKDQKNHTLHKINCNFKAVLLNESTNYYIKAIYLGFFLYLTVLIYELLLCFKN